MSGGGEKPPHLLTVLLTVAIAIAVAMLIAKGFLSTAPVKP